MTATKKLPPTHQAAIDRLKRELLVRWKETTGNESRALIALEKKNLVRRVFQPYGNTYFELILIEHIDVA